VLFFTVKCKVLFRTVTAGLWKQGNNKIHPDITSKMQNNKGTENSTLRGFSTMSTGKQLPNFEGSCRLHIQGTSVLRNIADYLPVDAALHTRRRVIFLVQCHVKCQEPLFNGNCLDSVWAVIMITLLVLLVTGRQSCVKFDNFLHVRTPSIDTMSLTFRV
jgi:hypothetical protein